MNFRVTVNEREEPPSSFFAEESPSSLLLSRVCHEPFERKANTMRTSTFDAADLTASQLGKSDLSGYGWERSRQFFTDFFTRRESTKQKGRMSKLGAMKAIWTGSFLRSGNANMEQLKEQATQEAINISLISALAATMAIDFLVGLRAAELAQLLEQPRAAGHPS